MGLRVTICIILLEVLELENQAIMGGRLGSVRTKGVVKLGFCD